MAAFAIPCPGTAQQLLDEQFLEQRERLLEIAAFLDRLERTAGDVAADHRFLAFRDALDVLCSATDSRTARVLDRLSDPTEGLLVGPTGEGAVGAYDRSAGGVR